MFINKKFEEMNILAFLNIFIQLILPKMIKYLNRTFKEDQNDINFKNK